MSQIELYLLNPTIGVVMEAISWLAAIAIFFGFFLVSEKAGIAKSALSGKLHGDRKLDPGEAALYLSDLGSKRNYIWMIPVFFLSMGLITYRQVFVHPESSIFAVKILIVLACLAVVGATIWGMNYILSTIDGPEREQLEAEWNRVSAEYAKITNTQQEVRRVNLASAQRKLRSSFWFFLGSLFATVAITWALFA